MRVVISLFATLLLCTTCNNLLDADLTERATFIKVYNGIFGIEASDVEITSDGDCVVLGTMKTDVDSIFYTLAFRVDSRGNRIDSIRYYRDYKGFTGKTIEEIDGQGFLIVGDRLSRNPNRPIIDNIDIYVAQLLPVSKTLEAGIPTYISDPTPEPNSILEDYKATSAIKTSSSEIVVLGTYQKSNSAPQRPFLRAYSLNLQTIQWEQNFESEVRSYKNAKSVHYINGNVIWASGISLDQVGLNQSYVSIPTVQEGSVFVNNSQYGTNDQFFIPNEIQPANSVAHGFGVIGTRSNSDGTNANMFFMRVDAAGNIIGDPVYFDAVLSTNSDTPVTPATSQVQDYGTAITSTSDGGFVLAGHFITANGTTDILLIKLDLFGNMVWMKTLGGTGSETVTRIRETDDQGLLLCGSHVIGGISSIFLIKTDKNGELKN